ncbi:MAG: LysR family transcriptional regulator [Hyphomicrobiales bacterium]
MNEIQIRNLDLNLLLIFRVLMEEGSVNRAAEQLGRTPSAVSHALGRLRDQLGDPLLVRTGGIMKPSPRAESLYREIQPILSQIERAVQRPAPFNPATSSRIFKMAGPALDAVTAASISRMHADGPNTGLVALPYTKDTLGQIISGEVDIAYGNANFPLPEGLKEHNLRPLKRYVFARREHPAGNEWCVESWMKWPHVVVHIPSATHGTVSERFTNLGLERRIGLHAASWSVIAPALKSTNMFGNFIALCLLEGQGGKDLQIFEPPKPIPDLNFRVIWKAELDADPAITWLRDVFISSFEDLLQQADNLLAKTEIIKPRQDTD